MGFTVLDYWVLIVYLALSAIIGALLGRGQKTLEDYFLAGKNMPWWAISLSIVATETSTLTFIGAPAIAYAGNLTFLQVVIGYFLGRILVSIILIPGFFYGNLQTAYEILNRRFGPSIRNVSAFIFQVTRALSDGVRLFATALVLSVVTDLSDVWTVLLIGLATIAYTFYGGMRAVIWNDVAQLFIYTSGALLAFFVAIQAVPGGWSEIINIASVAGKFHFLDFTVSLHVAYTFWAGLVGGAFLTFATHGTDQMMVQRYLACGNARYSQIALIVSGVLVFLQFLLFLLIGVVLFSFYQYFPLAQEPVQVDRIFPIFIVDQLPSGVSGLIIAAIFAAAMSTLSSSLNSLSSSSVNDFYKVYVVCNASNSHYLKVSRIVTILWGILLMIISMLARNWGELLQAGLTITSLTMGSILGVFLLGIWTVHTSQKAALVGMLSGLILTLGVHFSGAVAWTWYVLIGTTTTFLVGVLFPSHTE